MGHNSRSISFLVYESGALLSWTICTTCSKSSSLSFCRPSASLSISTWEERVSWWVINRVNKPALAIPYILLSARLLLLGALLANGTTFVLRSVLVTGNRAGFTQSGQKARLGVLECLLCQERPRSAIFNGGVFQASDSLKRTRTCLDS
jgi:hypothetical protein